MVQKFGQAEILCIGQQASLSELFQGHKVVGAGTLELSKITVHPPRFPLISDPSPPACKDKAGETGDRRYKWRRFRITFRETFLT